MKSYIPRDFEPKWQAKWAADKIYAAADSGDKPKFMMLTEFPYPSGAGIHLGHAREYTYGDMIARFKRMQGYNVLFPMGFDAFGLPTENYAIKNKISPQKATADNVANFITQLKSLGYSIDWDRSFNTSDPDYYKWTQWLFLKFYEAGLAYQAEIAINWCPFEKTGLANEEVVNGRHERCGTVVEKKFLKQWLLRITDYADRLIDGLKDVDYPSRIADQQISWIGRSQGAIVKFAIGDDNIEVFTTRPDTIFGVSFLALAPEHPLLGQITTAEQLASVNNYVLASAAKGDVERQDTDREKTGVFTGAYATNPVNGESVPIWVADYVLMGYGTGAIMAVPAHDERDIAFAEKFNLPAQPVIAPYFLDDSYPADMVKTADRNIAVAVVHDPATDKYCIEDWNYAPINRFGLEWPGGGMNSNESIAEAAKREFTEETGYTDVTVDKVAPAAIVFYYTSHLNKPTRGVKNIVHLTLNSAANTGVTGSEDYEDKAYAVNWLTKEEILASIDKMEPQFQAITRFIFEQPVYTDKEGVLINSGKYDNLTTDQAREKIVADLVKQGLAEEKINYRLRDWVFSRQHYWGEPIPIVHCPKHGTVAVPVDQLPIELPKVEHYEPTDTGESPLASIDDWVNTTCPECGGPAKRETDTMPNWAGSSWYYLRYMDAHNDKAFADADKMAYWSPVDMYLGGMEHTTLHLLYSRFWHQFLYDQKLVPTPEPYTARRGQGIILATDGTKMSKTKGNVVNPTDIIDSGYGADSLRLAIAFLAPYEQTTPWSPESVAGTYRFLQRVWNLVQGHINSQDSISADAEKGEISIDQAVDRTVKKVGNDLAAMNFNTAIASLMELVNELFKIKLSVPLSDEAWQQPLVKLVKLLAPFAPHLSEELWQQLGQDGSVHLAAWPTYDENNVVENIVTIVIQVNGKLRSQLRGAKGQSEEQVLAIAMADEKIKTLVDGKTIRKTIYIADKLLNIVV